MYILIFVLFEICHKKTTISQYNKTRISWFLRKSTVGINWFRSVESLSACEQPISSQKHFCSFTFFLFCPKSRKGLSTTTVLLFNASSVFKIFKTMVTVVDWIIDDDACHLKILVYSNSWQLITTLITFLFKPLINFMLKIVSSLDSL